jgi:hypothetical protein
MMMRARFLARPLWTGVLLAGLSAGCGGEEDKWKSERPAVAPASGTVTYKGDPVAGATVTLVPQGEGTGGAGITQEDGSFTLKAFQDPGVVPGSYRVIITKREAPPQAGPEGGHDEGETPPPRDLLPSRYADPATSGITVEIPADGKDDLKFELTD